MGDCKEDNGKCIMYATLALELYMQACVSRIHGELMGESAVEIAANRNLTQNIKTLYKIGVFGV
jgi:hypothetical protein